MKKNKNLFISITVSIVFLISMFIFIGKVHSALYNPSESAFLSANASNLLRKIFIYGTR